MHSLFTAPDPSLLYGIQQYILKKRLVGLTSLKYVVKCQTYNTLTLDMCGKDETVVTANLHPVLTDGTFFAHTESQDGQILAKKATYQCIDTVEQNKETAKVSMADIVAIICLKDACTTEFCVSKCCPEKELFNQINNNCAPVSKDGDLWTSDSKFYDNNLNLIPEETMKHVKVEYGQSFMVGIDRYGSSRYRY